MLTWKERSTLKRKNLLQWEQILSFMRWPQFIKQATMTMTELLPEKVYHTSSIFSELLNLEAGSGVRGESLLNSQVTTL